MSNPNEGDLENHVVAQLQSLGWEYKHGSDFIPHPDSEQRKTLADVVLRGHLRAAIDALNPGVSESVRQEAFNRVLNFAQGDDLASNNERFHQLLTEGITVNTTVGGEERGVIVQLVDFDAPGENHLLAVNQLHIKEAGDKCIPDVILFINGLPLVVAELKNPTNENTTVDKAFSQIQFYKKEIPSLFHYNGLIVVSDGFDARAGSVTAGISRMSAWKSKDGKTRAGTQDFMLDIMLEGMLNRTTLLDLIRSFTVFEKERSIDKTTGITTIHTIKKVAAYHQYYAVNFALQRTLSAASDEGDRKGGVVWHTQGSGKSLSMVFYTGKVIRKLNNPTVIIITDRNDLDDQLFGTFSAAKNLLRQTPQQADSRSDLRNLLKVASGGVIFTTIQKFWPEDGNTFDALTLRSNVVVIADEAHRTQYGFAPKTIDDKDEQGEVIGKRVVYGFAKYMRDALPNATYLGFTGTPVEKDDANTSAVFGDYVDIYDIQQAVDDGATVPIFYESRLAKVRLSDEGEQLLQELEAELDSEEVTQAQRVKAKYARLEAIVGAKERVKTIAQDLVKHFEDRSESNLGKAMVVAMSRQIAVQLYNEIVAIRPDWHHDDLDKGCIKVIMTSSSSDGPEMMKHSTSKDEKKDIALRVKDPNDELKLVIVRDMWLTGFDAPCLHTLYVDKPMKGHTLMQAIARVNRVFRDKAAGLIVDYIGIATDLKTALQFYSDSGGKGDPAAAQEQAVDILEEKVDVLHGMFLEAPEQEYSPALALLVADPQVVYITQQQGVNIAGYDSFDSRTKMKTILAAYEHIMCLQDGKKRFLKEVTAMSKAFSIAIPHDRAMDLKPEVGFFQAVKAAMTKTSASEGRTDGEIELAIKQVIDQSVISEGIVDILDAAGIKSPDISILSDDFLKDLQGLEYKNVALETLRKLLNDEIKGMSRTNLVQSRSLREMLEQTMLKYQNRSIDTVEALEYLLDLAKRVRSQKNRGEALGLSTYELAFYDALAENASAVELMGAEKLSVIARAVVNTVKQNATIDWKTKQGVQARMRRAVKKLLEHYGYPPNEQALAELRVMATAEAIAEELI